MAAPKSKPDINLKTSSLSILKTNSLKVGLNALTNRLANINGKIELAWLNLSYELFKIKCKKISYLHLILLQQSLKLTRICNPISILH